jgi:hypothetical protein
VQAQMDNCFTTDEVRILWQNLRPLNVLESGDYAIQGLMQKKLNAIVIPLKVNTMKLKNLANGEH